MLMLLLVLVHRARCITLDPALSDRLSIRRGIFVLRFSDYMGRPITSQNHLVAQVNLTLVRHDFPFGTAYSPDQVTDPAARKLYTAKVMSLFNALVPENMFKWPEYEPCQNCVMYDALRASFFDTAVKNGVKFLRGHALEWFWSVYKDHWSRKGGCLAYEGYLRRRITRDVAAHRGMFLQYDVINELLHERKFVDDCNFAWGNISLIVKMFQWAHIADPEAALCINEYEVLDGQLTDRYVELVRGLIANGAPIHCLGVQSHVTPSLAPVDIRRRLDKMAVLGLPIYITEVSVYSGWRAGQNVQVNTLTEQQQADYLDVLVTELFLHPAVHGIMFWGFWDGNHWIKGAGFYRTDFTPKLSGRRLEDMLFNRWMTRLSFDSKHVLPLLDDDGALLFEGFYGRYRYDIHIDGRIMTRYVDYPRKRGLSQLRDTFLPV
jgi:GH35 family endo-1,4-beta-xylanase